MKTKHADEILDAFEDAFPFLRLLDIVQGIQIAVGNDGSRIEIMISGASEKDKTELLSQVCEKFQFGADADEIAVHVVEGSRYHFLSNAAVESDTGSRKESSHTHVDQRNLLTVDVLGGDPGKGIDLSGYGTAGWSFFLDDVPVCISNHHVFCGQGNNTPLGRGIQLKHIASGDAAIAELYAFEPVYPNANNVWDYALAEYDNSDDWVADMVNCSSGSTYNYPNDLSRFLTLQTIPNTYHKVGARTNCTSGSMTGRGRFKVDGNWFVNQYSFALRVGGGDSGSVIIRSSDDTVTGLLFAGSDEIAGSGGHYSTALANPINEAPWELVGWKRSPQGLQLPQFIGPATFSDFGVSSIRCREKNEIDSDSHARYEDNVDSIIGDSLDVDVSQLDVSDLDGDFRLAFTDDDRPRLSSSKSFLGVATRQEFGARIENGRPGGTTDTIRVQPDKVVGQRQFRKRYTRLLCFGRKNDSNGLALIGYADGNTRAPDDLQQSVGLPNTVLWFGSRSSPSAKYFIGSASRERGRSDWRTPPPPTPRGREKLQFRAFTVTEGSRQFTRHIDYFIFFA